MLSKEMCLYGFSFQKTPTEQLQIAYEILEKAINDMNTSRLMTLLPDGKSIVDNCCTKVKFTKSYTATKSISNILYFDDTNLIFSSYLEMLALSTVPHLPGPCKKRIQKTYLCVLELWFNPSWQLSPTCLFTRSLTASWGKGKSQIRTV